MLKAISFKIYKNTNGMAQKSNMMKISLLIFMTKLLMNIH